MNPPTTLLDPSSSSASTAEQIKSTQSALLWNRRLQRLIRDHLAESTQLEQQLSNLLDQPQQATRKPTLVVFPVERRVSSQLYTPPILSARHDADQWKRTMVLGREALAVNLDRLQAEIRRGLVRQCFQGLSEGIKNDHAKDEEPSESLIHKAVQLRSLKDQPTEVLYQWLANLEEEFEKERTEEQVEEPEEGLEESPPTHRTTVISRQLQSWEQSPNHPLWQWIAQEMLDFTPQELHYLWLHHPQLHPLRQQRDTVSELSLKLEPLLKQDCFIIRTSGGMCDENSPLKLVYDWKALAQYIGPWVSPADCYRAFLHLQQQKSSQQQRFKWTPALDCQLLAEIDRYGLDQWSLIASHLGQGLNATQCLLRYVKSMDPSLRHGRWLPVEDRLLQSAISSFTKQDRKIKWAAVAKRVPGRSDVKCRERWMSQFKLPGRRPFTPEEDERLLSLVADQTQPGADRPWAEWASTHFQGDRLGPQLRSRYTVLRRRKQKEAEEDQEVDEKDLLKEDNRVEEEQRPKAAKRRKKTSD